MMVTEKEAKQKWCPMVRRSEDPSQNGGFNSMSGYGREQTAPCIASRCMMWRGIDGRGFCGLAGDFIGRK